MFISGEFYFIVEEFVGRHRIVFVSCWVSYFYILVRFPRAYNIDSCAILLENRVSLIVLFSFIVALLLSLILSRGIPIGGRLSATSQWPRIQFP